MKEEHNKRNPVRKLYDLFGAGLSFKDFERLIKNDAPGVLEFYMQKISRPDETRKRPVRYIIFMRELFVAFLNKLAPIRRFFYAIALLFFGFGYFNADMADIILSFIILNLLLAFELADKMSAKNELDVAREIQESILPQEPPVIDGFEISCFYETAKEVGGDYYDFVQKNGNDQTTLLVIGDISGKGMGAALYMIQVQAIFRMIMKNFYSPKEILINLNIQLKNVFRSNSFFTVSAASINNDKTISVSRAGHLPLYHFSPEDNTSAFIKPNGIGIGLRDNGIFEKVIEEIKIMPKKGDVFVFYTDGLSECMDKDKNEFGEENLKRVISKYSHKSADELRALILSSLKIFSNGAPRHDDITFIILKAK